MARGRVGGSRSKISGAVGTDVYKIVRNPNGTYSQVVQTKGVQTVNRTTPKLQAQRMATAMVESMMKQLKPIGQISMQSGFNKTKSLNAFSSMNIYRVLRDMQAHWYSNNDFVYPEQEADKNYMVDLGGLYLISSGTLNSNLFSKSVSGRFINRDYIGVTSVSKMFYGVQFDIDKGVKSVSDFFAAGQWTFRDSFACCIFWHYITDYDPETGDATDHYEHSYLIGEVRPDVKWTEQFSEEVISQLFSFKSNKDVQVLVAKDFSHFLVGFLLDNDLSEECYYQAQFSVSYLGGRKRVSSSSYEPTFKGSQTWLSYANPAEVFGSWMGERWRKPYPCPY